VRSAVIVTSVIFVSGDDALRFAVRLLGLLNEARYSATYKLATLLALIDVVAESTGPGGSLPESVSGKEVGRRVVELYWPQTVPYGAAARGEPRVLSQAAQNDIPSKLAAWRVAHHLGAGASLEEARDADPVGWAALEADLVAVVIGMPLAKLQRFGKGQHFAENRFIYDFSWHEEVKLSTVTKPGFDDSLRLRPGVGDWLVRLAPLIRPLVQAKWAARIAVRNADLVDAERLNDFLFGAQRISLTRVHGPLADAQDRQCFYCSGRLTKSWDVDHFLPWSRHPDNTLDNLVAAHARCNGAKSASLAGLGHLRRWIERFADTPASHRVEDISRSTGWPRRPDRVLSTARATYLWLPAGTLLWRENSVHDPLDPAEVRAVFDAIA
jgi:HNH endonuclease